MGARGHGARVGPGHSCYRISPIRFLTRWRKRRPEPGLVQFQDRDIIICFQRHTKDAVCKAITVTNGAQHVLCQRSHSCSRVRRTLLITTLF